MWDDTDETPESDVLMPIFQGCSTQMHRSRHENFPTLPKTREEVQLEGEWAETTAGQPFVIYQGEDMVVLSTDDNLRLLAKSQIIFVDGTFKAAPRLYRQLLTIHGLYCRHTMPLVYCLLADKKRESYYDCLDHVKRQMVTLDIVFDPPKILCDFEVGLISALRSQFPNASTNRAAISIILKLYGPKYKIWVQHQPGDSPASPWVDVTSFPTCYSNTTKLHAD